MPSLVFGDVDLVSAAAVCGAPVVVSAPRWSAARCSRRVRLGIDPRDGWSDHQAVIGQIGAVAERLGERPVFVYGHDEDVVLLSDHRRELEGVLRFVAPSPGLARSLVDKAAFSRLAEHHGLPVPRSSVLRCEAGGRLPDIDHTFPVIIKPTTREPERWVPVAGRAKALMIRDREHLQTVWAALGALGAEVLVQDLLPGDESAIVSYHVYVADGGEVVAEFSGRKIRTWPHRYGHSTAVEIGSDISVLGLGREILAALDFAGVAKLDFKPDADGNLRLLEINPRFSLWNHLAARCGVDIVGLVRADLLGEPRPDVNGDPQGQWCNPVTDFVAATRGGMSMSSWLSFARGCAAHRGLDWSDPAAAFGLGAEILNKGTRRMQSLGSGRKLTLRPAGGS